MPKEEKRRIVLRYWDADYQLILEAAKDRGLADPVALGKHLFAPLLRRKRQERKKKVGI